MFPVEVPTTEEGPECPRCFGRNIPKNLGSFCGWVFLLHLIWANTLVAVEGTALGSSRLPWECCWSSGGEAGTCPPGRQWRAGSFMGWSSFCQLSGRLVWLALGVINWASLYRVALPREGSKAVVLHNAHSVTVMMRETPRRCFEGGKGFQVHPVPPFSFNNFRSWKSLSMCHVQSFGRETAGALETFFPLYPPVIQVSGRQHKPSKR